MKPIYQKDLKVGTTLRLINQYVVYPFIPKNSLTLTQTEILKAGTLAEVLVVKKDSRGRSAYGLSIDGFKGGHDLNGAITDSDKRFTGVFWGLAEIKRRFYLAEVSLETEKIDFNSVILADHKKEQIIHALNQIENNDLIFVKWGFGKTFEKGRGVSMLFYGPPGTGKTLMAQAISHKLNYTLKVISNADIQSSVPGEAERNIRKHFKENKGAKSILLFDECDSLIFSRHAVGAILGAQINELLSQLERFEGITIFTTNRLGSLDEAVNRRLSIKVEFAMPTIEERIKIWQRLFPKEAPLEKDINWKKLAKHKIAGGHIKNAVLRAAREAANQDKKDHLKKISQEHLEKGLKQEIDSTREFHKAKYLWEGRYYAPDSGLVEDNNISVKAHNELKRVRQSVKEMRNG